MNYIEQQKKALQENKFLALVAGGNHGLYGDSVQILYFLLCMTTLLTFSVRFLMHDIFHWNIWGQGMFSLAWTVLIGFVLITVGAAIEYGILLLVYKTPVSKMAIGAGVRSRL